MNTKVYIIYDRITKYLLMAKFDKEEAEKTAKLLNDISKQTSNTDSPFVVSEALLTTTNDLWRTDNE